MIEIKRNVVCEKCGRSSCAALESEDPREVARTFGWVYSEENDEDICPVCLREKEDNSEG